VERTDIDWQGGAIEFTSASPMPDGRLRQLTLTLRRTAF
jgi:hypothetical protein